MTTTNTYIPKKIKKLDETVINRISAGEVIHRPINVIKELIENCLDANSTRIEISVKDGGIKSIVIQDNGCGIQKEDLDLVCERHTTSKLQTLDDLFHIQSYGFRGEALASISYISYVTIVSKTKPQMSGFKQIYIDGKPKGSAIPLAANDGTIITVEDLFYNLQTRKKALNSYSNEYNLILDLLTSYAIHYSQKVGFSLRKSSDSCDINSSLENTINQNISQLLGPNIANNLIEISFEDNILMKFSMNGLITNQNIHQKNYKFILFINDRLVECRPLKRAIDLVYNTVLMKGFHPFIYLNIMIDSNNIDVNIHPTKSEVRFLHEQEICEKIVEIIGSELSPGVALRLNPEDSLMNSSFSESFSQSLCKSQNVSQKEKECLLNKSWNDSFEQNSKYKTTNIKTTPHRDRPQKQATPQRQPTLRPDKQIRTDSKDRKIEEFLLNSKRDLSNRREMKYNSLLSLRESVNKDTDSSLQNIICGSSYVGCVDQTFILFQYETQLLLVNGSNLNRELFYQLFLIDFGNFPKLKFSKPSLIIDLLKPYLKDTNQFTNIDVEAEEVVNILFDRKEMICDYFAIDISEEKKLTTLPVLLNGYIPNFGHLGQFLYQLAKEVDWTDEKQCFHSVGSVLSQFYGKPSNKFESDLEHQKWAKMVETVIYPTYKAILCPPKRLANNCTFFVTTNLMDLYKVFERC